MSPQNGNFSNPDFRLLSINPPLLSPLHARPRGAEGQRPWAFVGSARAQQAQTDADDDHEEKKNLDYSREIELQS